MTFRDREKERYRILKPKLFSQGEQPEGVYRRRPRYFCLDDQSSSENLFPGVRASAIQYFKDRRIPWHDGLQDGTVPSNHLCCSQSCCVNFLYPLVSNPERVKLVLDCFYPELAEVLPSLQRQAASRWRYSLCGIRMDWHTGLSWRVKT